MHDGKWRAINLVDLAQITSCRVYEILHVQLKRAMRFSL